MASNMFERDAIKNLQLYLRQLSYHNDSIPSSPIDGIWDSATERSLSEFQRYYKLPITGRADRVTWEKLKTEYDSSVSKHSPPVSVNLFPRSPESYALEEGAEGFLAKVIIYILGELSATYGFPVYEDAKALDSRIIGLILEFQRINGLNESGKVDKETWDRLANEYNLLEGGKYN